MPFKLEHNKNYAYLFLVIVGLTLLCFVLTRGRLTGLVFSLCFYYLAILQLHSRVALNSFWTAKYKKEEHPFIFWTVVILCFVMGTLYFTIIF
jgi:hypothetical protein